MAATTVTTIAKRKMLLARAGDQALPKITGMAFGTGGVNANNQIVPHTAADNALHLEVLRKAVEGHEVISDTRIRYRCTIGADELVGIYISECGIYDADGDFVALKSFTRKCKDADMEVVFECDDIF